MFYCLGGTKGIDKTYVYQLASDWNANEATWMKGKADFNWFEPGGDPHPFNKVATGYAEAQSWEEYNVTAIVTQFLSSTPNYGFLLINDKGDGHTGRLYASSDYITDNMKRPKLIIKYVSTGNGHTLKRKGSNNTSIRIIPSFITISTPANICQIDITNLKGRKILATKGISGNTHQIPISKLAIGVYLLHIQHRKGRGIIWKFPVL